jgi:Tc5 transposase DNA-binding domain
MDQASRALSLLDKGRFKNINQTARGTGVARSTLQDRHAGKQPLGEHANKATRLTRYQEKVLAAYIQDLQLQYAPVNNIQLAQVATLLARQNEPNAVLGVNWITRFFSRHPHLKRGRNRSFEASRI